jgi:hypothetical protein
MGGSGRLRWLRRALLAKAVLCVAVWGLPALLMPPALAALLGVRIPADPTFFRLFGAVVTALGVLYWQGHLDPVKNVAIVRFGVADNGLIVLTLAVLALTSGITSWFIWLSGALAAIFAVAFALWMPGAEEE